MPRIAGPYLTLALGRSPVYTHVNEARRVEAQQLVGQLRTPAKFGARSAPRPATLRLIQFIDGLRHRQRVSRLVAVPVVVPLRRTLSGPDQG